MFNIGEAVERQAIVLIRTTVGVVAALGALAGLYHLYGRVAVALAGVFTLGVLHLVIEYKQTGGGGQDTSPA